MIPARRALEVAVFAPVGVLATVAAKVHALRGGRSSVAPTVPTVDAPEPPRPAAPAVPAPRVVQPEPDRGPTAPGPLPIEGYDHLAASQVIDRLDGLTSAELIAVEAYERAHKHRQIVLGRLAQLVP